jgi:hypothetical protein
VGETITVPRPRPDQVVLAAADEDGATCWVTMDKTLAAEDWTGAVIIPLLAEGQKKLHDARRDQT